MKKLGMILCALVLLTGCSLSYNTELSDGSDTLASTDSMTITKQDLYLYILENYGADEVLDEALRTVADLEITDEDEVAELVEERQETYASYADDLEDYATSLGYEDADQFTELVIEPDVKQTLLIEKYIDDNYDDLIEDYQACSLKVIIVEKESEALTIIEDEPDADDFDALIEDEYSDEGEDYGVVTKNTSLDDNLLDLLEDFMEIEEEGVYEEAILLSDDTYAAVYIYDCDKEENSDTYKEALESEDDITDEAQVYYLKKYEFTVYEQLLKEEITEINEDYFD